MLQTPTTQQSSPLSFRIVGHLWFFTLMVYSIVYVAERFTYVDSAWQLFSRINDAGFIFPSNRYGVFFSQLPVFIIQKLGGSFTVLVYAFSLSFILLYYLLWYLCTSVLKNAAAGLAIIFCTFMGVREGFLHPVTETQQCMMFCVLLYAQLRHQSSTSLTGTIFILFTTLLILFTHPTGVFMAGFAALLSMIDANNLRSRNGWIVIALLLIISVWRFLSPTDNYDAAIYDQLKGNISGENNTSNGAINFLLIHFTHFYWVPELAALIAIIWLAVRKDWMRLGLTITGIVGYLITAAYAFPNGDSSILMERAFLPACFMVSLVFAGMLLDRSTAIKWIPLAISLFFMVSGLLYINNGCLMYKKRTAYLDELVTIAMKEEADKFYVPESRIDRAKILIPWGLGTETLMYSTFRYNHPVTITFENEICDSSSVRLTSFYCYSVDSLNRDYFPISRKPYQPLP